MEYHPLVELFPLLEGEEFQALVDDIKTNGLMEPIWLYEGRIIDGRNRYRACMEAGVEPTYREWSGNGSVEALVQSLNIHRRHLTVTQRALIATQLLPRLREEAKHRQIEGGRRGGKQLPPRVVEAKARQNEAAVQAGRLVGVGATAVRTVMRAEATRPDLVEKLKAGQISARTANREMTGGPKVPRMKYAPEQGRWRCPICHGKGWVDRDPGYEPFKA